MKKLLIFSPLMLFIILLLSSCPRPKGDWDDIIKLSTKSAEFSANGDSVLITTGGSWWWVSDVSVNDEWFYNFQGINLEADSYIIKENCFNVERRDKHTLFIKVYENPLSVKRIITVGLEAGDYFDRVTITQKPK